MAVRSKNLAVGTQGVGSSSMYTAPSGETVVVKFVTVYNANAAGNGYGISMRKSGSSTDYWVINGTLAATTAVRFDTWIVLQPGDSLRVTSTLASIVWTLHGAELEGVAD